MDHPSPRDPLRTAVCELLGIDLPIFQAPMSSATTPEMVAAVSTAGGLGILPGVNLPPEQLRADIRAVGALTDRPFAVNLLLHRDFQPVADPASVDEATWRAAVGVSDRFRAELGMPAAAGRPPRLPDVIAACFEVIVEERVPVFSIGLGHPNAEQMAQCREREMKVVAMAATVPDAMALAEAGVDVIVAQGGEAGGHRSTWVKRAWSDDAAIGTMVLVPQVVQAVKVPVVAAGGVTIGSQLAAALVLGASGVHVGTRFIATRESKAPGFHKDAVVEADSDETRVTDVFTGLFARVVRNRYSEEYAASGAPVLPPLVQYAAAADLFAESARRESGDFYPLYAGQGCGLVNDIPCAADVVRELAEEARAALRRLQ